MNLLLAWFTDALAVPATLCADVTISYSDIDPDDDPDTLIGDRWTTEGDKPARGFSARVRDVSADAWVWPDSAGSWGNLEDEGPDVGCVTVDLEHDHYVRLEVRSEALVGGQTIRSWDNNTDQQPAVASPITYQVPLNPHWIGGVITGGDTEIRFNHLALAAFALFLYDGPVEPATLKITHEQPPNTCGAASGTGRIDLAPSGNCALRRYVVAHEIGHVVARRADQVTASDSVPLVSADNCNGGGPLRKNWAKYAMLEGLATLYSAMVWNHLSEEDCEFAFNEVDWNLDGYEDPPDEGEGYTCVGDPFNGTPNPDDRDWLEDLVNGADVEGCVGPLAFRTTEYDFVRYVWELLTLDDLPVSDLWAIIGSAEIYGADPDDNAAGSPGDPSTSDDPFVRWESAMDAEGWGTEHDARKSHGLDH